MTVEVLGLDGDDTLWRNEEYFADTQQAFRALLAPFVAAGVDLDDRLNATERANLELFGYGVKGFTLSLDRDGDRGQRRRDQRCRQSSSSSTWARPCSGALSSLLEGVAETIPALAEQYRLIVITKGDLLEPGAEARPQRPGRADVAHRDRGREGHRDLPADPRASTTSTRPRS